MSRLHSQKRRVRAFQRTEGIIAPGADEIDKAAIGELGTSHEGIEGARSEASESTGPVPAWSEPETPPGPIEPTAPKTPLKLPKRKAAAKAKTRR